MDYPHTVVTAGAGEARINVTINVRSDGLPVTDETIATLVRDHLASLEDVTVLQTVRHTITQTNL
ncbi:hypothetical protein H8N00_10620 [Streptomyces sp. AC563]|uniref:hypothetical protein n=1 Tax=Streptomyces buecherae TaxID=2763006 RepID=UPI00164CDEBB|nr:hypothetical protein [Streptomyces buecherae]MBC3989325.1 hypothetical protein [Streptomyces buecherae]